jgi:hypothetical protein
MTRRWDEDERGIGIARGDAFAPGVERLLGTMRTDGWVAEQPEAHLLPHIRRWCEENGRFRVLGERSEDAVSIVELEWTASDTPVRELPADLFEDETHFHTHGHLLRFRVAGKRAVRSAW